LLTATTEEKAAAFDSYAAYFGTFTVDAKAGTVTHHLENNLVPGREVPTTSAGSSSRATIVSISFPWKTAKEASSPAKTPPINSSGSVLSRAALEIPA